MTEFSLFEVGMEAGWRVNDMCKLLLSAIILLHFCTLGYISSTLCSACSASTPATLTHLIPYHPAIPQRQVSAGGGRCGAVAQ